MNTFSVPVDAPIFQTEHYRRDNVSFNLIDAINATAFLRESDGRSFLIVRNSMDFPAWIWTAEDISEAEFAVLSERLRLCFADKTPHFVAKNSQLERICKLFEPYEVLQRLPLVAYRMQTLRAPAITEDITVVQPAEEASLLPFVENFTVECFGHCDEKTVAPLARRHASSGCTYALRKDGQIVSVACHGVRGGYADVAFVYTEKEYRGRGYAAQVVATVCNKILQAGGTPVLYADANNPVSNHIYRKLGFEETGRTTELRLQRKAAVCYGKNEE